MRIKRRIYLPIGVFVVAALGVWSWGRFNFNPGYSVGQPIDSLNGVMVFYNGAVGNVSGRNTTEDDYNLGLKYQCVEFVKRYYYAYLAHKMPDSYGHAKDFFDRDLADGEPNTKRDLIQYSNPSRTKPRIDDLLVFGAAIHNRYGHVAIVSEVRDDAVEIIQQNPGPFGRSRITLPLCSADGKWEIKHHRIAGWLRKEHIDGEQSND